ncbi:hypothetical protein V6000_000102 [Aspergillus fumigatus]|jgi:hypothetical protein
MAHEHEAEQATMPVVCAWNTQAQNPRITTITPPVLPSDETQQPAERIVKRG